MFQLNVRRFLHLILLLLLPAFLLLTLFWTLNQTPTAEARLPRTAGDPLPRITCEAGYTAAIYAENLSSPDGLTFSPDGLLYVSEESAGRVSQVSASGVVTPLVTGLQQPEGLAFDTAGNLYIVEDRADARLIKYTPAGITSTLTNALTGSEGVVVSADDQTLYVTESNVAYVSDPRDGIANVTAVSQSGVVTRMITSTFRYTVTSPMPLAATGTFESFAALTRGSNDLLYVTNELSGLAIESVINVAPFGDVDVTFTSTKSIFTVDPLAVSDAATLFASNLVLPEGDQFAAGGFPLYVAEEDSSGDDQLGTGRLSRVASDGTPSTFCTGFSTLEGVTVGPDNAIYVSEDGTGLIIRIAQTDSPETPTSTPTPTPTATPIPSPDAYLPLIVKP